MNELLDQIAGEIARLAYVRGLQEWHIPDLMRSKNVPMIYWTKVENLSKKKLRYLYEQKEKEAHMKESHYGY